MGDDSVQDILCQRPDVQLQRRTIPLNVCSLTSQPHVYAGVIETTVNTSSHDFIDAGLSLDILESLRLVPLPSPRSQSLLLTHSRRVAAFNPRVFISFRLAFSSWLTFS